MAPKKKQSSKRTQSSQNARPSKVARPDAPLIEREELDEASGKRDRTLRPRTTDEDTKKCERDNFKGYTYADKHHNIKAGKSLHQTLCADIHLRRHNLPSAVAMGKDYYTEKREMFPSAAMRNATDIGNGDMDETLPKDADLDAALEALVSKKCQTGPLLHWFETTGAPNDRVIKCVAKAMIQFVLPSNSDKVDLIKAHMQWVVKHGLKDKHPKIISRMQPLWVAACTKSLSQYKNNRMTSNKWWAEHSVIGSLVVDGEACDVCMRHDKDDWSDVEASLVKVVTANDFGYHLFAKAAQNLFKTRLCKVANDIVQKELRDCEINHDTIEEAKQKYIKRLKEYGADFQATFPVRPSEMSYCGMPITLEVISYSQEWTGNVQARIRTVGVGTGLVKPLFGEKSVHKYQESPGTTVAEDLLKDTNVFRENALDLSKTHDAVGGDEIKSLFTKKKKWFHSLEKWSIIERNFFCSLVGQNAIDTIRHLIMDALPTAATNKSVSTSLMELRTLGESEALKFAGAEAKEVFNEVETIVERIHGQRHPNFPVGNNQYLCNLKTSMGLFLAVGDGTPENKTIYGKDAAKLSFDCFSRKMRTGAQMDYSELTPLVVYSWLLPDADQQSVKQWSHEALAAVGKKKLVSSSSGSGSSPHDNGDSKKAQETKQHIKRMVSTLWST